MSNDVAANGSYSAFWTALRRPLWSKDERQRCEDAFRFVMNEGGRDSPDLKRDLDATFNPYPARLAQILLSNSSAPSPFLVCAAILSALPAEAKNRPTHFNDEFLLIYEMKESPPDKLTEDGAKLLLAQILDQARHLHMMTRSTNWKREWVATVRTDVFPCLRYKSCNDLLHLCKKAIERWEKRCPL